MTIQELSKSSKNMIYQPKIISRDIHYNFEPYTNSPKIALIIENKSISKESLNQLTNTTVSSNRELFQSIDYNDLNPSSPKNIFNFFSQFHKSKINYINSNVKGVYKNSYTNNNFNFAYHYFIDKMGNIYEGRPHSIRAFNLDIYQTIPDDERSEYTCTNLPLLNQGDLLFNDCLIILTEEDTSEIDTTNSTYASLKSLLVYLKQKFDFKKFYTYSELKQNKFMISEGSVYDITKLNNPGLFFKTNELHSFVENIQLPEYRLDNNILTYSYGMRVLRYTKPKAMKGNDVELLQKMLYKLNIISKYKQISSEYDLITKNAVEKFQKLYYITPEYEYGTADKNTLNTLRNEIYKNKMNNIQIIDLNYKPYRILEYIEDNQMCGDDVLIIQTKLKTIINPLLTINGIYDLETQDTVKMYQTIYNFATDGKVGPILWEHIISNQSKSIVLNSDSVIPYTITPSKNTISSNRMKELQMALNEVLKPFGRGINVTGIYDVETQNVIKIINSIENNRKILNLDKLTKPNGDPLDWTDEFTLKSCYPYEYLYLIKHYLLNMPMQLNIIKDN